MKNQIEVIYTGGGITIVEANIGGGQYAVVSTEALEFLTIYNRTSEEPYLPEDMVASITADEMTDDQKELYNNMIEHLQNA